MGGVISLHGLGFGIFIDRSATKFIVRARMLMLKVECFEQIEPCVSNNRSCCRFPSMTNVLIAYY